MKTDISGVSYRHAEISDTESILSVLSDASNFLRNSGVDQWQDGFPDRKTISDDISSSEAFVLTDRGQIIGFFVLSFVPEDSYTEIIGEGWLNKDTGYAVIHRAAISSSHRGRGISRMIFSVCEQKAKQKGILSIRIDTHEDNDIMRHLIIRNGYKYCGIIRLKRDDTARMAFEKLLI